MCYHSSGQLWAGMIQWVIPPFIPNIGNVHGNHNGLVAPVSTGSLLPSWISYLLFLMESCNLLYVGLLPSPIDILRAPMVDIQYHPGSSSSGNNKDAKEFNIEKWVISDLDLREISTFCSSKLRGRFFPPSCPYHHRTAPSAACFASEAETNDV